jgi:hypothetical protein
MRSLCFGPKRKATFTRDGVLKMFKRAAEAAALPFPIIRTCSGLQSGE